MDKPWKPEQIRQYYWCIDAWRKPTYLEQLNSNTTRKYRVNTNKSTMDYFDNLRKQNTLANQVVCHYRLFSWLPEQHLEFQDFSKPSVSS